jgi:DNA-directed RNA polymerase subunit F
MQSFQDLSKHHPLQITDSASISRRIAEAQDAENQKNRDRNFDWTVLNETYKYFKGYRSIDRSDAGEFTEEFLKIFAEKVRQPTVKHLR